MGVITYVQLLGGTALFEFGKAKKRSKFSTFYDNFRVQLQISLDWIEISTSSKWRYQAQLIPH